MDAINDKGVSMVLWIDAGYGSSLRKDDDMMWFGEREVVGEVTIILCEEGIGSKAGGASNKWEEVGSVCG